MTNRKKEKHFLTSLEITVTPLSFSLRLLFVCHVKIYFRVDWWSDLNTIGDAALCFAEDMSFLTRKRGFSFSPPLSGIPRLFGSVRLLLIDWNPLGNKGPQCAGKGSTWATTMRMDKEGGVCVCVGGGFAHCSLGAFVSDIVPLWGLMRTNWSECNKWIIELDKGLYFVGCVCWDPPIICPLSRARWLASAWSGSLNISLFLSCLFYYTGTLCV